MGNLRYMRIKQEGTCLTDSQVASSEYTVRHPTGKVSEVAKRCDACSW